MAATEGQTIITVASFSAALVTPAIACFIGSLHAACPHSPLAAGFDIRSRIRQS
jgi:hypothetical protein